MVMGSSHREVEVVVVGSGPGGYVAALRLADLGKEVLLVEERARPGGTCLLEGCIPSKALINAVGIKEAAENSEKLGLSFSDVKIDSRKLRAWTDKVVDELAGGINGLLRRRQVEVMNGRARFTSNKTLSVIGDASATIEFEHCVVATGSSLNALPPGIVESVWSSGEALELREVPETLLVVGGGYIGLELALVYQGLGSKVSVVEFFPRLLAGADQDLVDVMIDRVDQRLHEIMVESKVKEIREIGDGFEVEIEHDGMSRTERYDKILVAIGRRPNSADLGLENTAIVVNEAGFIETDSQCRTAEKRIFAIGDVATGPMLAHKASREGKVAAEVIAGQDADFDNRAIPAVVFTDPEIAWTGLTEHEAETQGIAVNIGSFPLSALGRARSMGRTDGLIKVISEPETGLLLGVGMVGPHVSELIAEGTLALEMGATLEDLMVTVHPHPTLSEALMEAAEAAAGVGVHMNRPRS